LIKLTTQVVEQNLLRGMLLVVVILIFSSTIFARA